MLLSLSRQNECGFEVDLFYFFLGCLIVQLMKIKLLLFILGAGFSYLLIILRSSFPSLDVARDNEFPGIEDENFVVIEGHLHSPQLASNNIGSMVENLSTCLKALQLENSNLIEILLEKLEEYLSDDSELAVFDPEFMINAFPPETIDNIHKTAKMMVSTGFEREFSDMYSRCRRECLVESLSRLWFQKLSFEGLQMLSWKEMEDNIKRWIKVFKVTLNILLPTERQLCDQVFFGFSAAADLSFTDVCMESTLQLLSFTKAMAIIRRSHEPEQLFRVLELFETMRDIIPEFKSLFRDQYSGSLQNEVATIWKRLGEGIKGIFMELENLIRYDAAQSAILSGGIHPITRYVMNHLRAASRSRKTLEQVFEDRVNSSFSLSVQIGLIMELLNRNLEAKSKIYKDPTLCYVFLMNNCRYILLHIKDSELGSILGDAVIQKHTAKVRLHHANYQSNSWNKMLEFLKLDTNASMQPNEEANSMKMKLKSFNMHFEKICRVQSSWFIFDKHLKREIITSIVKDLLPAYAKFIR
ncbi:exocyst complex component, partial [Trifolium pratense]